MPLTLDTIDVLRRYVERCVAASSEDELFGLAHAALSAMRPVAEGLEVDTGAMQRRLQAAGVGEDVGQSEALVRRALAQYGKDR